LGHYPQWKRNAPSRRFYKSTGPHRPVKGEIVQAAVVGRLKRRARFNLPKPCDQSRNFRVDLRTQSGRCGVTYELGSQQRWSHSSFNAAGQLFSDAKTSGSHRALASPN
jgi:hypothetical protein